MEINKVNLIGALRFGYVGNKKTLLEGLKCCLDMESGCFSFMRNPEQIPLKKSTMIIEDWERFYRFDAADDYEDPNVFVAECIVEEFENRMEMDAAYEEVINELIKSTKK